MHLLYIDIEWFFSSTGQNRIFASLLTTKETGNWEKNNTDTTTLHPSFRLSYEFHILKSGKFYTPIAASGSFGILTTDSLRPSVRNTRYITTILLKRVFTSVAKKIYNFKMELDRAVSARRILIKPRAMCARYEARVREQLVWGNINVLFGHI